MSNELQEYISVSEYAKFIEKTTSHVYALINDGIVPCVRFKRGTMNGLLVLKPNGYDEWKVKQSKK